MNVDKSMGYEVILAYFAECQKRTPKGVGFKVTGGKKPYIHLRITLGVNMKTGYSACFTRRMSLKIQSII